MEDHVILVNEKDETLGSMPKLEAHRKGLLHRAFSVFLFNSNGELLLQQRALDKYHSPGLWSNSCCSHPLPGEETEAAALRRLKEEMGLTAELRYLFSFTYKIAFDNGLTEHEFDHVFTGVCDESPAIDKTEIENWKYMAVPELLDDIKNNPHSYTDWFKLLLRKVLESTSY